MNQTESVQQESTLASAPTTSESKYEKEESMETLASSYNLPLVNRDLLMPDCYVQAWSMAYYYPMYAYDPVGYENYMKMCFQGMPTLNEMATSHNTEEAHSSDSYKPAKGRKFSNELDFENFEWESDKKSKKSKSDMRLKYQEKRLQENGLSYESRETYNPKTKRTSRVLVCLHEGCGKEFKKTRNLIIHSRVHTKIRPHICQFCNKGFTQQCNLKKHIELHKNGTFKANEGLF
jgi:uncharacterized Zn-finger protein